MKLSSPGPGKLDPSPFATDLHLLRNRLLAIGKGMAELSLSKGDFYYGSFGNFVTSVDLLGTIRSLVRNY